MPAPPGRTVTQPSCRAGSAAGHARPRPDPSALRSLARPHGTVSSGLRMTPVGATLFSGQLGRVEVAEVEVGGTHRAVLATAELVAVAREPAVEAVEQRAEEGELERPPQQPAVRQDLQQLLDGVAPLPGLPAGADQLHRLGVGLAGDPGEAVEDGGVLEGEGLDLAARVPAVQEPHQAAADLALAVVHHRPGAAAAGGVRLLPAEDEAHHGDGHAAAAPAFTFVTSSGGCLSVTFTVQRSATRCAAARRFSGRPGQSMSRLIDPTRCGSSTKLHPTSTARSSAGSLAFVAQACSTERVQVASELASMWKGEYDVSADSASMVMGPAPPSSRMRSSESRVIF